MLFTGLIVKTRVALDQWFAALLLACGAATAPGVAWAQAATLAPEETEQLYLQAMLALADNDRQTAQRLLQRLVNAHPDHAGAWLDLAVLYCNMGDGENANALWNEVEARFAPPPGILDVIALQRQQGCKAQPAATQAAVQVNLGRGQASNVNQGVRDLTVGLPGPAGTVVLELLPQYAAVADQFTQWGVNWQRPLVAGVDSFVQAQGRHYDQQHRFSVFDATLGVTRRWQAADWHGRWQASLGLTTLGGALYQWHQHVQLWAVPPWQPVPHWRWALNGGLHHASYPLLPAFNAWQWDARLTVERTWPNGRMQGYAGLLHDRSTALRPGGQRNGWALGLDWQHDVGTLWSQRLLARLGLDWQQWKSSNVYTPGFIEVRRAQRMATATAALVLPSGDDAAWVLEARQVRNHENIGLFAYDARTVQLSYQRTWGRGGR